jgi:putative ABC transport system permease protein
LTRQLLTESLLLSLFGGTAGVAILFLLKDFLLRLIPENLPHLNEISISWNILLFALVASVVSGVLFGLAPALQASRLDLNHALKQEGRSAGSRERGLRQRRHLDRQFKHLLPMR